MSIDLKGLHNSIVKPQIDILTVDPQPQFSTNIDYPRFSLGFHHYIHATRRKMELFNKFEGKRKVYLVVNEFEPDINDYNEDMYGMFAKTAGTPDDTRFFVMAELLYQLDKVLPKNITFALLGDDQARNIYSSAIKTFRKNNKDVIGDKADLVIYDVSIKWTMENIQEQESFKKILSGVVTAIKTLKKDGVFVCKMFETFTNMSVKIIAIISTFFNQLSFSKPSTSRAIDQEKFLICQGFAGNNKDIKLLDNVVNDIIKNKKNIVDIFPSFKPDVKFLSSIILHNISVANQQIKYINLMVDFINSQNYFGELYHKYRDAQIKTARAWLDKYLT